MRNELPRYGTGTYKNLPLTMFHIVFALKVFDVTEPFVMNYQGTVPSVWTFFHNPINVLMFLMVIAGIKIQPLLVCCGQRI